MIIDDRGDHREDTEAVKEVRRIVIDRCVLALDQRSSLSSIGT